MKRFYFLFLCIFLGCVRAPESLWTLSGQTMGSAFRIKVARPDPHLDKKRVEDHINALLDEVNRQMSTYRSDSELSQFNLSRSTDWIPVSRDLAYVLSVSLQISDWSQGAFDITVGPLVNLWGFGPKKFADRVPPADSIRACMTLVGYQNIEVDTTRHAVRKRIPAMYCDLSAIAKGFGADKVADYLDSLGVANYFIDLGGSAARLKGRNAEGEIWRVGITSANGLNDVEKVVLLDDKAIATSGDYHNYFEKNGVRYSHIIDPITGRPITHKLASVSVVCDNCTYADGLSTAIDVMGPEKGLAFAEARNLPVFMIVKEGDGFVEKMSPAFAQLLHGAQQN